MAWPSSIRAAFSRYTVTSPEMKREAPAGVNSTPKRKTAAPGKNHSNDRPGVFRLNIGVGRETYDSLFDPAAEHDFTALDRLMPHPVYGRNHWVCVLNPGEATFESLRPLLTEAYDRAVERHTRSTRGAGDAEDAADTG